MIEHGGNSKRLAELAGCAESELLDFSVNLNPAGIPEGLFQVCFKTLDDISPYPEAHADTLRKLAAEKWELRSENILFGNGSTELISLLPRAINCKRALIVTPGYLEYAESCRKAELETVMFPVKEEDDFKLDLDALKNDIMPGDLVFIGNPCNPVGTYTSVDELHKLVAAHPEVVFVIDEAFADFCGHTMLSMPLLDNLVILRSMTKYYAIAGIRLGYAVASAQIISDMLELQDPWSVGTIAARAGEFLLKRDNRSGETRKIREDLVSALQKLGLKVYPSEADYLLVKSDKLLSKELLKYRIAVRDCSNYPGLNEHFIRIAVRTKDENIQLLEALRQILCPQVPAFAQKRKRPALMLQGTCSNAGKSVLTAAFCRIMLQDGYAVAPFKSQNMALNSYVTPDGCEIGRAQAVQAEACRLDPDARMNPILLKPNSDTGSQLVLHGKPTGHYNVKEYFSRKKELWHEVTAAYDSLSGEFECIVLEGAGSPGEVNLKSSDIVNMRMAQYAQSPVLLAGDIDRGGVYASFIGTYATLEPWERELLYGFLVNKFRGDSSLLADAHDYVVNMTGKPVVGVIDYQHDLGLPEEDSVSFGFTREVVRDSQTLDVALIYLDHIANFTDFAPLEIESDVKVRTVSSGQELGEPDLIILPGSKSVVADIAKLRSSGLFDRIKSSNARIAGICGGLQILGQRLLDPEGIESSNQEATGLCMLPFETIMRKDKTLRRNQVRRGDGTFLSGYEIHHGESYATGNDCEVMRDDQGNVIGFEQGRIFATYLHGVFDDDQFRRDFLNEVRKNKGWELKNTLTEYGIENALNFLAEHVRSRVNMKQIYKRMGLR